MSSNTKRQMRLVQTPGFLDLVCEFPMNHDRSMVYEAFGADYLVDITPQAASSAAARKGQAKTIADALNLKLTTHRCQ